jgi:tripartite-type tricarboxylate transporter receptor subunit TctC
MKVIKQAVLAGLALALATGAAVAEYPERPITLIVPWAAGGGTDATGRIIATMLEQRLGQPVNVVNRTGGGGIVGHEEIKAAEPDGYTLGIITTELSMYDPVGSADMTYDDFTLLGLYNADPSAVFVKADSPYETIQDLAEAIKQDPAAVKASCRGSARPPPRRPGCRRTARHPRSNCWRPARSTWRSRSFRRRSRWWMRARSVRWPISAVRATRSTPTSHR